MIRKALRIIYLKLRTGTIYKLEYYSGLLNVFFTLVINIFLWQALYSRQEMTHTIQYRMMITYVSLSIILQAVFIMDEFHIQRRIRDGSIFYDLFKPFSFRLYLFFDATGRLIFNLALVFLPVLLITGIFIPIMPPVSVKACLFFVPSLCLGFVILFAVNFTVWIISFDTLVTFGYLEIKNALITVLSGALVPLWFMPDHISRILGYLPFQRIYYFPLAIYLGIIPENEILKGIAVQLAWAVSLIILGHFVWKVMIKKAVIQGG